MKRLSLAIAALLGLLIGLSSLTSCDDDGPDVCTADSYVGTFVGKYWLLNLIPLDDNDTVTVTVNGNTISLRTNLLGTTFNGAYDASTGQATVSNLVFNEFTVGNDTLFDITVDNGLIELDAACDDLFISLSGVDVNDGTVNLPDIINNGMYPLTNASMNTRNGLSRQ